MSRRTDARLTGAIAGAGRVPAPGPEPRHGEVSISDLGCTGSFVRRGHDAWPRAAIVTLAERSETKLVATVRASTSPQRAVLRARIVLLAAEGWGVARPAGICRSLSRRCGSGVAALPPRTRWTSRPPAQWPALSLRWPCTLSAVQPGLSSGAEDLYRNHWTTDELRRELLAADLVSNISVASVARLLADADLRPYRFRMWVHSPDPQFREKVAELCALYTRPVGPNQVVVCIDEKTGMQALRRRFPGCRPGPAQSAAGNLNTGAREPAASPRPSTCTRLMSSVT